MIIKDIDLMDFVLVFFSEMTLAEWGSYLYCLLQRLNVETTYHEDKGGHISICCPYFTLFLDTGEELGMDYYWEEFAFRANIEIELQMFVITSDIGIDVLFKMLSLITEEKPENFILLDINGVIILKREADVFYKSNSVEEYGKYGTHFPYNLLSREIKEVNRIVS